MTKMISSKKTLEISAWLAYSIIFFEMLYMSTPFAVFFYSVYKTPLQWLISKPSTAWLVQTIFPHFSKSSSVLVNIFLYLSFPLMTIGLILFLIGFGQIYYAKFRKKGAVTLGLYRYIRHPQYTAWLIFGLGMCFFWSRMLVWLAYVAMVFIYYYLALHEEKECTIKYGDTYQRYLENTGRFLPRCVKSLTRHHHSIHWDQLTTRSHKIIMITLAFVMAELLTVGIGLMLKKHSIQSLYGVFEQNRAAIALMPTANAEIEKMIGIVEKDAATKGLVQQYYAEHGKQLIYVMPHGWNISELMKEEQVADTFHDASLFANPSGHGNTLESDASSYRLLFSTSNCPATASGRGIVTEATAQIPILLIELNIKSGLVTEVTVPEKSRYSDVPVPVY